MKLAWDQTEPCQSCPYRKDAERGFWHPDHFLELLRHDADPFGPMYQCHQTRKLAAQTYCAGWLLDQRRRDFPNLMLRMAIMRDKEGGADRCFKVLSDGGHEMFPSIEAMAAANLRSKPKRATKKRGKAQGSK